MLNTEKKLWDTLRIFTSTLYGKTKTKYTNPNPDPNRYRMRCPDRNAMIQKKELQIKTEEDGNFKAEKYKTEIEVNILNTTRSCQFHICEIIIKITNSTSLKYISIM